MAKYLVLWEVDTSRTPEDSKAKKTQWLMLHDITKKFLKEGAVKEWGLFVGSVAGYLIFEGSAVEVQTFVGMWLPFSKCTVRECMTFDESLRSASALPE